MLISARVHVDRALIAKGTLYDFVTMAWPQVEPSSFVPGWHLEEICIHLEAISRGELTRLIINQPPGTSKSSLVSVFWNVWEWIKRPETKYLYASYDASLVCRDANKVLHILRSPWFLARWGNILADPKKAAVANYLTTAGGFRFSTSPAGKATGRHSDIQVVDDPIKPKDASGGSSHTRNALRAVSQWWQETMASRASDPRTFRRVITMQRLHEEDLAGEMAVTGKYTLLCLPMRYEGTRRCVTPWGGDRRTSEGELLSPVRHPEHAVKTTEEDMGPDVASAQLQQRPTRKGGGTFRRAWWRFWHTKPDVPEPCLCDECFAARRTLPGHIQARLCRVLPNAGLDMQSWDSTFKRTDTSDFVAGGIWRVVNNTFYLVHVTNERRSFSETLQAMRDLTKLFPRAYDKLLEDSANGPAIEDTLRQEIQGIVLCPALGGKEARANACTPAFAAGSVAIAHPDLAPWTWPYMAQLEAFPHSVNDDMVDMTSQALIRLRQHGDTFAQAMDKLRGKRRG